MMTLERMIKDRSKESAYLIVLCESKEDFDRLMDELEDLRWCWMSGDKPTRYSPYSMFHADECVYCTLYIREERISYRKEYFGYDHIAVSELDEYYDDDDECVSDRLLDFLCGLMGCKE